MARSFKAIQEEKVFPSEVLRTLKNQIKRFLKQSCAENVSIRWSPMKQHAVY